MLKLKEARKALSLSQAIVANKIGVAQNTYSQYESGDREPSYMTLCELSNIFEVSTDYLIGNIDKSYEEEHINWYFNNIESKIDFLDNLKNQILIAKKEDKNKLINAYKTFFIHNENETFPMMEMQRLGSFMNFFQLQAVKEIIKVLYPDVYTAYSLTIDAEHSISGISGFDYKNNKFISVDDAMYFLQAHNCFTFDIANDDDEKINEKIISKAMELKERIENDISYEDLINNTGIDYIDKYTQKWLEKEKEKIHLAIKKGKAKEKSEALRVYRITKEFNPDFDSQPSNED